MSSSSLDDDDDDDDDDDEDEDEDDGSGTLPVGRVLSEARAARAGLIPADDYAYGITAVYRAPPVSAASSNTNINNITANINTTATTTVTAAPAVPHEPALYPRAAAAPISRLLPLARPALAAANAAAVAAAERREQQLQVLADHLIARPEALDAVATATANAAAAGAGGGGKGQTLRLHSDSNSNSNSAAGKDSGGKDAAEMALVHAAMSAALAATDADAVLAAAAAAGTGDPELGTHGGPRTQEAAALLARPDGVMRYVRRPSLMDKLSNSRDAALSYLAELFAPSVVTEVREQLTVALPLILGFFADHLVDIVDLIFLGHLTEEELAAGALGILFINVTTLSLVMGMMGAMDTLIAQAFGAKNYRRVGHIFQRALLIVTLLMGPMIALRLNGKPILRMLGFPKKTCAHAGRFLKATAAAIPAMSYLDAIKRYLQAQNNTIPVMYITCTGVAITLVCNVIFVVWLQMGYIGIAYTTVCTAWGMLAAALGYLYVSGFYKKTWSRWSRAALRDWGEFLSYALPSTAMLCAEWWGLELQSAISGLQGSAVLGAQSIIFNIMILLFMAPMALAIVTSARVGALLGSDKPADARFTAKVSFGLTIALELIICLGVWAFSEGVGRIFTDSPAVLHAMATALPLVCVYCFFDGLQGMLAGVLRGCGLQDVGFYVYSFAYWGVGLPLAYVLAMKTGSHLRSIPLSDVKVRHISRATFARGLYCVHHSWMYDNCVVSIVCFIVFYQSIFRYFLDS